AGRRFPALWRATVAGSTLGSTALCGLAWRQPAGAATLLVRLPGGRRWMLERAADLLARHGVATYWRQPWTGLALRSFVVVDAGRRQPPWPALPISVAARALRFALSVGLAALLGARQPRLVRDRFLFLAAAYVALGGYGWWATQ